MAHHDSDSVVIGKRFGCEIAEHPQMAMFTINAIFRGVMGMKRGHGFTTVQFEVYRIPAGRKAENFLASPLRPHGWA
jgi:hypothetical protein